MANRNAHNKEKSISGLSFVLNIPVRFSISATKTLQNDFKNIFEKKAGNQNKFLKQKFLEIFKVKNEINLISENQIIRKNINNLKCVIKDEAGLDDNEFSDSMRKEIIKKIEECNGENIKQKN